ncbi:sterol desaturase family protein [Herbaspirillum robiniae]|uniref:Sterol desaturase family protein n=1 Tax=Herbaspirillum robiniae TaxID=2014887 RepID=A0ABX2M1T0_9BURK|nr:sterol desaturase family protein [Herbaspirillum robiniae]NUU03618.1 sterol desaturase family protein [Herbaspirillum robiniae]
MNDLPNIMLAALPAFTVLMLAEGIYAWRAGRGDYRAPDTAANIVLGLGSMVIGVLSAGAMLLFLSWLYTHRVWTLPVDAWWVWALCFFADDLSYYWFHRISHEVRWFWASHSVHHSSEQYNFSVAVRQTWTGVITGSFLFWFWMPLVGFHPKMVLFMQSVSLIYQFWIHTQSIGRMPSWFEAVFNTPSHHRVHHGSDFDYLDANYAGTLIIWDRLFGSYIPETFKPKYGLTSSIGTDNPIRIAFYEWRNIARDLRKSRGFSTMLNILFQPPGWSADGSSMTTRQARAAARRKDTGA